MWQGPAYGAGLNVGMTIVAVNGKAFDIDTLKAAVADAAKPGRSAPIELLTKADDRFQSIRIDYHGGIRYPRLERIAGRPDMWSDILKAK